MTTSPVPSITEELLAELELHARQAVCDAITDGFPYDPRIGLTTIEENFCVAANPATILALIAHIRSLEARLGKAEKDASRYRWLRGQHDSNDSDYAVMKFSKRANEWLHLDWKLDAEINRAIAQEKSHE